MTTLLEPSLIRIFHPKGYAVGVGFLVDDHHAMTCAHVVASVLGLNAYPENPPTDELTLDFPLIAHGQKLTARVVAWQIPTTSQGDVAVLEIASPLPEKAAPARLIQSFDLWHHTFRAFGFPKNHENGTWATGRILGTKAGGWQQIESTEQTGYFVQPGFSGGPVWDERLGGVVGMIMEAEAATRAAFMSPVGVLAASYPKLAEKIEQIITPVSDAPAPGEPPFKGMLYFDVQDAPLFFGRETLTEELAQRLSQDGSNFLAIVGASGSGKSSLARAGLIPAIMAKYPGWIYRVITPTTHPLQELAVTLTADVESVTAATTLIDDLAADPRSLDIGTSRFLKRQNAPHMLLVVDQFEELFTACKDLSERKAFIDNLLKAVGVHQNSESTETSKVSIVLTLRADFYHHCAQYDNLRAALEIYQAYIGPMTTADLRLAIEAPARQNGWDFEPELVDVMLHDVNDEPGALPLLSHALLETWQRRKGRTLTLAGYHAAGGVRGAISQTADRVYSALPVDSQTIARDIFLRLTELGEGTQDTRRRASLDELISDPTHRTDVDAVLKTLTDARLITTEKDTAEVTHEALIREWPALREWLDENREGLRLHRHLTETAKEWHELGQDQGELYRGLRLSQALEWVENDKPILNEFEQEFLAISQAEAEREVVAKEAAFQRELELANRVNRITRWAFLLSIIAAISLGGLAYNYFKENTSLNSTLFNTAKSLGQLVDIPPVNHLSPFAIETYEVTNARYILCIQDGVCTPPNAPASMFESPEFAQFPVANVTAIQALQFCNWIDRRLPTDAEWQWAALYPGGNIWPWGDKIPSSSSANFGAGSLLPVGFLGEGQSVLGIFDLAGNVWEWTSSDFYNVDAPPWINLDETPPNALTIRGGGYLTSTAGNIEELRQAIDPYFSASDVGFRCVASE
ncbi:MAG: SUMF1/EgtB/PvdO family nonheme iron enzyme [Anaerolineales bacterium]|nr:SUMF1/EgtB/PvdO family nonheme iron enzyme [Anaerolineales bacterium]